MAYKYRPRSAEAWDRRANQSGGDFEGFIKEELRMWSPKKGANAVRLLPPTYDEAIHYAMDIYVHYSVGPNGASVLCNQHMKNERCPICEARNKALKIGDEEGARELKAAKRALVWMVDRNDEDRGAMLWAMPFTLDRTISGLAKDRRTGKIYQLDDPDQGYDVYFDKVGEKMRTEYVAVQIDRNPSSVDSKILDYIEDRPLPDTLIWRDYAQVTKLFNGGSEIPPDEAVNAPIPLRRDTNGKSGNGHEEPVRRRLQAEEPQSAPSPREAPRRRVAPSDEDAPNRREEINQDVPWKEDEPATQPARSAADRLRERFRE